MDSNILRESKTQISVSVVFAAILLLFIIGNPATFLSMRIYYSFMVSVPFFAIMALSLTLIVICGEIDLSFPAIMGFSGFIFTTVFHLSGSVGFALFLCVLVGLGAGLLNGLLIVKLQLPSLVTTLGTQFFWMGFTMVASGGLGKTLVPTRESVLYNMMVGRIGGIIPAQILWMVLFAVILWVVLNRHRFGAHIYYTGDNPASARVLGINVNRVKMIVFTQMGAFSAFAGVISSLEVVYFWPTLGQGYLLRTIAAVFLGGTPVEGGIGTIYGTFIGALIIGKLEAGIIAMGMHGFWTQLIYGLIVVVSIAIHSVLRRR